MAKLWIAFLFCLLVAVHSLSTEEAVAGEAGKEDAVTGEAGKKDAVTGEAGKEDAVTAETGIEETVKPTNQPETHTNEDQANTDADISNTQKDEVTDNAQSITTVSSDHSQPSKDTDGDFVTNTIQDFSTDSDNDSTSDTSGPTGTPKPDHGVINRVDVWTLATFILVAITIKVLQA